jgi:hypothetical protein
VKFEKLEVRSQKLEGKKERKKDGESLSAQGFEEGETTPETRRLALTASAGS